MKSLLSKRERTKRLLGLGGAETAALRRWNAAKFDDTTGQMYLETVAVLKSSDDLTWEHDIRIMEKNGEGSDSDALLEEYQKKFDSLKSSRVRSLLGARSLQDAAIETVLQNISSVTQEGIECLPLPIVRRIWKEVNRRRLKSFRTWCIFSQILRRDDATLQLSRYHQNIASPNRRLDVYTNPLISESFEFLASLSITVSVPVPDLIKLSSIKNLGVLEIINTTGKENISVGDRLIRSWSTAASNDGAFSVLRVMKLWNHEGLTTKSLAYLNSFLALALYDVYGCGFDFNAKVEATRLGWKSTLETDTLDLLETACAERAATMRMRLGMEIRPQQAFVSEHLWRGSKIRYITRADIPTFLSQPTPKPKPAELSRTNAKEKRNRRSTRRKSKSAAEAWDVPSYRAFARIGELRNDTDLIRAGVVVSDQAVVGSELINSVPMASLRLGKSPPMKYSSNKDDCISLKGGRGLDSHNLHLDYEWELKPKLATSMKQRLAFIRIKIPLAPTGTEEESTQSLLGVNTLVPGNPSLAKQTVPSRRQTSTVMRSKKRKLDDVLSSLI